MGFRALHDVNYYAVGKIADAIDPEAPPRGEGDDLLCAVHADLNSRGLADPLFLVSVHHRNIVLNAVAVALRKHITHDTCTQRSIGE